MFERYADIAFRLPIEKVYTYRIPAGMENAAPGMRVEAPLQGRPVEGLVTRVHTECPEYEFPLLKLLDIEPIVTPEQLDLAAWMSDYYIAGIGEALFKMFPPGRRLPKQQRAKGAMRPPAHSMNDEQHAALQSILSQTGEEGHPPVHLLHGITGSGKTEVYIHAILKTVEQGKGAILLVPEITLTVQLIERLKSVFGDELALLHSALKTSERFGAYMRLVRGDAHIAVGTRSAVFAPVKNLGLLILDEEHDASYKEHSSPRYHARQVAIRRAETEKASVVLGSATPSLESYYSARLSRKNFYYHRLERRATGALLPEVHLIAQNQPDIPVSGDLLRELGENLKKKEQSIFLLNRRGYSPYIYCPVCKKNEQCPNCSVSLNLHKKSGGLICHWCGYRRQDSGSCSICGRKTKQLGSGTQRLEEYLLRLHPDMRMERLDSDSATREVLAESIHRLLAGELDLLIGTQMIAKGLDAPHVTLVGVLQADSVLGIPDFRSAEKCFALLTQVAGRAGRGHLKGRVYFEVLNPEHAIIRLSATQDYDGFVELELPLRQQFFYPPFSRIIRLLYRASEESMAEELAEDIALYLRQLFEERSLESANILGPSPAPIVKLNNQYRYHVIIKTKQIKTVRDIVRLAVKESRRRHGHKDAYLEVDIDPVDLI